MSGCTTQHATVGSVLGVLSVPALVAGSTAPVPCCTRWILHKDGKHPCLFFSLSHTLYKLGQSRLFSLSLCITFTHSLAHTHTHVQRGFPPCLSCRGEASDVSHRENGCGHMYVRVCEEQGCTERLLLRISNVIVIFSDIIVLKNKQNPQFE